MIITILDSSAGNRILWKVFLFWRGKGLVGRKSGSHSSNIQPTGAAIRPGILKVRILHVSLRIRATRIRSDHEYVRALVQVDIPHRDIRDCGGIHRRLDRKPMLTTNMVGVLIFEGDILGWTLEADASEPWI